MAFWKSARRLISTSMVCASHNDPVAAIVQHASVRDIETVIVDGDIKKENHKLVPVFLQICCSDRVADVVKELGASRDRLRRRWKGINFPDVTTEFIKAFHIDEANLVETV